MNYYYRHDENGNCEVICTRCFTTIGVANGLSAAKKMEALHACDKSTIREAPKVIPINHALSRAQSLLKRLENLFGPSGKLGELNTPILFLLVVILLYALPTGLELAATKHFNAWLATILPGDVIGCACLIALFRMPRTGLILYLLLTICESILYVFHLVGASDLPWIVDSVPTLIVMYMILHVRVPSDLRRLRFF